MAFYRKNIGSVQQVARIVIGTGTAAAAFLLVDSYLSYAGVGVGLMFALTGIVGYCPMCAAAQTGRKKS